MRDEQINTAIAEVCGWTEIGLVDTLCGVHPEMKSLKAHDGGPLDYPRWQIPNYCNDLNAMHEAEKLISKKHKESDYWFLLRELLDFPDAESDWDTLYFFDAIHATARQRAEAFLKTINKWEA